MAKENSVEKLAQILKQKYQENPTIERLFYPDDPLLITSIYVNLQIVKEEEQKSKEKNEIQSMLQGESTQLQIESSRDQDIHWYETIYAAKSPIQLEALFTENKSQRILIEGRAGIGKSTLCQYIAYRWSIDKVIDPQTETLWQDQFDFVFWLPLRELEADDKKLIKVLERLCFRSGVKDKFDHEVKALLKKALREKKILWLLDGYDELVIPEKSKLKKLWQRLINEQQVILTSRPGYFKTDSSWSRLEVTGFNAEQQEEYIKRFYISLATKQDEQAKLSYQQKSRALQELLKTSQVIRGIGSVPINLELICSIYDRKNLEVKELTLTKLYQEMLTSLYERYAKKKNNEIDLSIYADIVGEHTELTQFLQLLAFKAMRSATIVLKKELLDEVFTELKAQLSCSREQLLVQLKEIGLLKLTSDGKYPAYYFLHLSFQEFFAARYISQQLKQSYISSDIELFIRQNKYEPRLQIMWWFVAGVIGNKKQFLENYLTLLSAEPKALLPETQLCLLTRCIDEAGVFNSLDSIEKVLQLFKEYWSWYLKNWRNNGFSALDYLNKYCLTSSSLLLKEKIGVINFLEKLLEQASNKNAIKDKILNLFETWEIKGQGFIEILQKLLKDKKESVSDRAAKLLGQLKINELRFIEELQKLLQAKESYVRHNALKVLEKLEFNKPDFIEVLVNLLDYHEWHVRDKALELMGRLEFNKLEFVEILRKTLLKDKKNHVRCRAAELLVKLEIKEPWFIETLLELLQKEAYEVRDKILKLLMQLGINEQWFIDKLQALMNANKQHVRYDAAKLLVALKIKEEWFVNALLKLLPIEEAYTFDKAVDLLMQLDIKEQWFIKILLKSLQDENIKVRKGVANLLTKLRIKEPWFIDALLKLLRDKKQKGYVRVAAAELLVKQEIKEEWFIIELLELLQDEDRNIRYRSVMLLEEMKIEALRLKHEILLELLQAEEWYIRDGASKLLVELEIKEPILIKVLQDSFQVKGNFSHLEAARLLGKLNIKDKWYIEILLNLLHAKDRHVQDEVAELLIKLEIKEQWYIKALLDLLQAKECSVRVKAVELLIKLGIRERLIIKILLKLLQEKANGINDKAAKLLEELNIKEKWYIEELLKFLQDENEVVQDKVANLLIKLEIKEQWYIEELQKLLSDKRWSTYCNARGILTSDYLIKELSLHEWKKILSNLSNFKDNLRYFITKLPFILIFTLCADKSLAERLLKFVVKRIYEEKSLIYIDDDKIYCYDSKSKRFEVCQVNKAFLVQLIQAWQHLCQEMDYPNELLHWGNLEEESQQNKTIKELPANTAISLPRYVKGESTMSVEPVIQAVNQEVEDNSFLSKCEKYIKEINDIQGAIKVLIKDPTLMQESSAILEQQLSNVADAQKLYASHSQNEFIITECHNRFYNSLTSLKYYAQMLEQKSDIPIDQLNLIKNYLNKLDEDFSAPIELHPYHVTEEQEVQAQALFFSQRYVQHALQNKQSLGNDLLGVLHQIKAKLAGNTFSCFISYAWPIDKTNGPDRFVQPFLEVLRQHLLEAGIYTLLDFKCIEAGQNLETYMKNLITCNHWLLIGTPSLTRKLEQHAYIEFELKMEKIRRHNPIQHIYSLIPIILLGDPEHSLPHPKLTDKHLNFSQGSYLSALKRLLKEISHISDVQYNPLWAAFETKYTAFIKPMDTALAKKYMQEERQAEKEEQERIRKEQEDIYRPVLSLPKPSALSSTPTVYSQSSNTNIPVTTASQSLGIFAVNPSASGKNQLEVKKARIVVSMSSHLAQGPFAESIKERIKQGTNANPDYKLLLEKLVDPLYKEHVEFLKEEMRSIRGGTSNADAQAYLGWLEKNYGKVGNFANSGSFEDKAIDLYIRDEFDNEQEEITRSMPVAKK